MFNPPEIYPNPGSYEDVLKRMTRRMQEQELDDQILKILQNAFEKELKHRIVLSRPDRKRLFLEVSKSILADVLEKMK